MSQKQNPQKTSPSTSEENQSESAVKPLLILLIPLILVIIYGVLT